MTSREDSENLDGTAASLRLELAACRLKVTTLETSLHSAEEALRETKAALEFSLTSGRIGDWDLDLIADPSRRSLRHDQCFGYDHPIRERDWGIAVFMRHVHPHDRARVEASLRGAIAESQDWAAEFRVIWPDGTVHWLDARGGIYRTTDGRPARMLGTI